MQRPPERRVPVGAILRLSRRNERHWNSSDALPIDTEPDPAGLPAVEGNGDARAEIIKIRSRRYPGRATTTALGIVSLCSAGRGCTLLNGLFAEEGGVGSVGEPDADDSLREDLTLPPRPPVRGGKSRSGTPACPDRRAPAPVRLARSYRATGCRFRAFEGDLRAPTRARSRRVGGVALANRGEKGRNPCLA